jgi:Leucine-rich repeat (LRR) protein
MLDQNHMTGSLSALFNLTNLRDIYLSRNHFHGSLPDGHLPTSLRAIFLNENEFIGLVPSFLYFHELQKIDLSKNIFSRTLRLNIFPSNIQSIDLSENILSGSLPSLRNLLQLSELSISDNTFSGSLTSNHFPSAIASVYLNENKFSGHLPNFQEYELLTTLDLSMNSFSGTIPSFLNVSSLISLSISNNHFTGVFSGTQFPLSLLILDVHSNELSDITSSICDLYLQNAYLLNNSFTCYPSCFAPHQEDYADSLPRCIDTTDEILCKLSLDWKMPDIIRHSVGPMDPIQLSRKYTGTFTNLRTIDVNATYYEIWFDPSSDANLGVSICLDVQCLSVIDRYGGSALRNSWPPLIVKNSTFYFVYYGNSVDITGVIVTVIPYRPYRTGWECKDRINRTSSSVVAPAISAPLEAVNYCSWSGIKCLGGSKGAVTAINLNAFGIIGNNHVKEILIAFPRLIRLNLGSNAINGGIDFVPHTRLRVLDLSFNTLNGTIPCSVNQLQRLEILSLKQNQFDGTVPGCIADTSNRKGSAAVTFDLAYNKFSGQIDAGLCSLTPASTTIILKNNPLIAAMLVESVPWN